MNKKRILLLTGIGAGIEFLVVLLTGIMGIVLKEVPLLAAIKGYGNLIALNNVTSAGFIGISLLGFTALLFVVNFIAALAKKKPLLILPALCLSLAIAFVPFLLLLVAPSIDAGNATRKLVAIVAALLVWNVAAIILLAKPTKKIYCDHQERPVPVSKPAKAGVSEVEVRSIVKDYIELHEENMHNNVESQEVVQQEEEAVQPAEEEEPAPAPVEEPAEEEPVEEADEDEGEEGEEGDEIEEVEVLDASGNLVKIKRRKRASFETRLKNSEYDIRHKYYDLRDYIKWYGLNNRISIPGDSFSYKRRKYAFITIVGKHIKFYIALDPDKYENSPIPVERASAKKYVDTPCVLRIKSDLSYRRAKLLVDDLMQEIGLSRPEGEEPKETQHPEK